MSKMILTYQIQNWAPAKKMNQKIEEILSMSTLQNIQDDIDKKEFGFDKEDFIDTEDNENHQPQSVAEGMYDKQF